MGTRLRAVILQAVELKLTGQLALAQNCSTWNKTLALASFAT